MPSIEQNRAAGQNLVNSGAIVPASPNTTSPLPIPVTISTYPAAPNPNLRGPLPASYVQQPDMQRQWQNAAVNQIRVPPSPSTSNPVVGAQAVSQTITIVQGGGGGGGTVLLTNGVKNTIQSTLNLISSGGVTLSSDSLGGVTIGATGFVLLNPTSSQTISGAPLILASTTPLEFEGVTSGSTSLIASAVASGTLTLPAATDTLVGQNTTDTLTNKTLTSPILNGTVTGTALQGTDSKLLTVGTVSGTPGDTLCLDANNGATTSGCSGGGGTTIKFVRQTSLCTPPSSNQFDSCTFTFTWGFTWASANYIPVCSIEGSGYNTGIPGNNDSNQIYIVTGSRTTTNMQIVLQDMRGAVNVPTAVFCMAAL